MLISAGCGYLGLDVRAYWISCFLSPLCTHEDVSTTTYLPYIKLISVRSVPLKLPKAFAQMPLTVMIMV